MWTDARRWFYVFFLSERTCGCGPKYVYPNNGPNLRSSRTLAKVQWMEPLNVLHEVSPKSEPGSSGAHTAYRERGNGKRQGGKGKEGRY